MSMKEYYKVEALEETYIRADVYYEKGNDYGKKRGYYVTIVPVKREEKYGCMIESFVAYSGVTSCILPVTRKSKKSEEKALQIFRENIDRYLANYFHEYKIIKEV